MTFADTHTHLYLEEFADDLDAVVQRALDASVPYFFLPNIDTGSVEPMVQLCRRYPSNCFAMAGLHPTSVKENYRDELRSVEEQLAAQPVSFFAVGEIGIDLYWDKTFRKEQEEAFLHQLDLAVKYDLPAVIHTRNSMDLVLGLIKSFRPQGWKGVFHCFGGNVRQAEHAVKLGFYLGIGGVITFRNSGLQQVVSAIPAEKLLLETDAPFLAPVPHRGRRNEPAYIPLIAARVAEIKETGVEEVADMTTGEALKVFGIKERISG